MLAALQWPGRAALHHPLEKAQRARGARMRVELVPARPHQQRWAAWEPLRARPVAGRPLLRRKPSEDAEDPHPARRGVAQSLFRPQPEDPRMLRRLLRQVQVARVQQLDWPQQVSRADRLGPRQRASPADRLDSRQRASRADRLDSRQAQA
jgi:hypothetical protein